MTVHWPPQSTAIQIPVVSLTTTGLRRLGALDAAAGETGDAIVLEMITEAAACLDRMRTRRVEHQTLWMVRWWPSDASADIAEKHPLLVAIPATPAAAVIITTIVITDRAGWDEGDRLWLVFGISIASVVLGGWALRRWGRTGLLSTGEVAGALPAIVWGAWPKAA